MHDLPEGTRDLETGAERPPAETGGRGCGCGRACLFTFLGFLFLFVIAVILVAVYWRPMMGSILQRVAPRVVESWPLPEAEKAEAKLLLADLIDAGVAGRLDADRLFESLLELKLSPRIAALTLACLAYSDVTDWNREAAASPHSPLMRSRLSDEEKQRFIPVARRFAAALEAGEVPEKSMDAFWNTLGTDGQAAMMNLSDAQLRALLSIMDSSTEGKDLPSAAPVDALDGLREFLDKLRQVRDASLPAP